MPNDVGSTPRSTSFLRRLSSLNVLDVSRGYVVNPLNWEKNVHDEIEHSQVKDERGGGMKKVDSAADFGSDCRSSIAPEEGRVSLDTLEDNTVVNFLHRLVPKMGTGYHDPLEVSKSLRREHSQSQINFEQVETPASDVRKPKERRTYSLLVLELFADGKRKLKHMRMGDLVRYIQGVVHQIQSTSTWEQDKVSSFFEKSPLLQLAISY